MLQIYVHVHHVFAQMDIFFVKSSFSEFKISFIGFSKAGDLGLWLLWDFWVDAVEMGEG